MKRSPPALIDGAVVLEWAWSDVAFGEIRRTDGAGPPLQIHGLALCQYVGKTTVYRFSCNASWETEADFDHGSIEEAKAELPQQYRRVEAVWNKVEV